MTAARNQSSSLRRALELLSALADDCERGGSPTLTELAGLSGINRSTVSRLLQPLIESRLVDLDSDAGRYRLGPYTARLGRVYLNRLELHDEARPILRQLVEESQETAHLGVRDGAEVVYIDKFESPLSVRTVSRVGAGQPLYCTAMGKVLLAHASRKAFEAVVSAGLAEHTPNTITDPDVLDRELARSRTLGYAIDDEENELGIRCVGAPVFDHKGEVVAAISLSGPSPRMSMERLERLAVSIVAAANEVSRNLAAPEGALTATAQEA